MSALVSFAALFASIFLVQLGSGSLGPLDALGATARGFSLSEIGVMGSAHFAGFLVGCFLAPRLIGTVGHSRVFAAAAAIGAVGALMHPVLPDPLAWAGLRLLTGIAIAVAYTVIESWLQAKTANRDRGRVYGIFRVIDLTGQIAAQGMVAVLDPASFVAYNVVAMFCCLCLLPLALSRRVAPATPSAPRLRPLAAWRLSPAAVAGVLVAALSGAAFRMVGPVYAQANGLQTSQIALFLGAAMVGGALAQWPVGWLADRYDRRHVLIAVAVVAAASCAFAAHGATGGPPQTLYLASALFGATAFPLYSLAATYANDYAAPDFVVDLNASLIFYFSLGAIAAPMVAAELIDLAGPGAMFDMIGAAHLCLVAFALYRATRRRGAAASAPYAYVPRTSMVLARLFRTRLGPGPGAPVDTEAPGSPARPAPDAAPAPARETSRQTPVETSPETPPETPRDTTRDPS